MALITEATFTSCRGEGLTGTRACPDGSIIGPAGEPEGVGPDSDAGEEVVLGESPQVICSNIDN
jgi:hypothetical protein